VVEHGRGLALDIEQKAGILAAVLFVEVDQEVAQRKIENAWHDQRRRGERDAAVGPVQNALDVVESLQQEGKDLAEVRQIGAGVGRVLPRSIWEMYSFENRSRASSDWVRPAETRS